MVKLIFLDVNLFNSVCMEKVKTLLRKLQQQINEGDSPEQLLTTAQMMQLELAYLRDKQAVDIKELASESINLEPHALLKPVSSAY